jgi:aminopeptidase YwaD
MSLAQSTLAERDAILAFARAEVDTLCSPYLGGRGYLGEGHLRARDYLQNRMLELGANPPGKAKPSMVQAFPIRINLPSQAKLSLDGQPMQAGRDFIVNRYSGSGKAQRAKVKDLGYALEELGNLSDRVVIFRAGFPPDIANDSEKRKPYESLSRIEQRVERLLPEQPAAIIVLQNKLTAGFTRQRFPRPVLEVQIDSIPSKIKRASFDIQTELTQVASANLMAVVPGTQRPDEYVVLTAHYDHLGQYEDAIFTGANDNASGVAMLLSMMAHLAQHPLDRSVLFIAFGGEETGLLGSRHYVYEDPVVPLDRMAFLLNLDLMGNGDEGIMAVGGKDYPDYFDRLTALNDSLDLVPTLRARSNAPNSDHFFFLRNGVPGFFVYTLGGPPHYHDVNDTAANLLLSRFVEVRELLLRFLREVGNG